jgi:hypothetical protein
MGSVNEARRILDSSWIRVLMGLLFGSPLAYSINIMGGARGAYMTTRHQVITLAATSSLSDPEILPAREVLAHPRVVFHPYTCRLRGRVAVVAALLIEYDDMGLLPRQP